MKFETQLLAEVRAFLDTEADMLDHKEYQQWLDLWDKSGVYIIPVDHSVSDYKNALNVAYDDDPMRRLRVERLMSGEAVSTQMADKTVRILSRVRILDVIEGVVRVRCAQCLYENNKNGMRVYPSSVQFKLLRDGESYKIVEKIVKIMNSNKHLTTVSYLF